MGSNEARTLRLGMRARACSTSGGCKLISDVCSNAVSSGRITALPGRETQEGP